MFSNRNAQRGLGAGCMMLALTAVGSTAALAQSPALDAARNVSVRERAQPEYAARGLRAGAFLIHPEVAVDFVHDDNVLSEAVNEQSDFIYAVKPSVTARSTWSRHQLEARANGTVRRYADLTSENSEEWGLGADGRLDIRRDSNLAAGVLHQRLAEPRSSSSTPADAVSPIEYDQTSLYMGGTRWFGRFETSARVDHRIIDFHNAEAADGGIITQDGRDRQITTLLGRVNYALSPDVAGFVSVSANNRDYDLTPPQAPIDRSSSGYEVLVGARFDLTRLVRGEVGVGYLEQSYDGQGLNDASGASFRAQVEWFPTQLTTVAFTAGRSIEEATLVGASSYLSSSGRVQVDHELRRNVILTGQASYAVDDFQGIDREDDRTGAGIGLTYLMNRNVGILFNYDYLRQSSSGEFSGRSFEINRFLASVVFKL